MKRMWVLLLFICCNLISFTILSWYKLLDPYERLRVIILSINRRIRFNTRLSGGFRLLKQLNARYRSPTLMTYGYPKINVIERHAFCVMNNDNNDLLLNIYNNVGCNPLWDLPSLTSNSDKAVLRQKTINLSSRSLSIDKSQTSRKS